MQVTEQLCLDTLKNIKETVALSTEVRLGHARDFLAKHMPKEKQIKTESPLKQDTTVATQTEGKDTKTIETILESDTIVANIRENTVDKNGENNAKPDEEKPTGEKLSEEKIYSNLSEDDKTSTQEQDKDLAQEKSSCDNESAEIEGQKMNLKIDLQLTENKDTTSNKQDNLLREDNVETGRERPVTAPLTARENETIGRNAARQKKMSAKESKTSEDPMKEAWPSKVEDDQITQEDQEYEVILCIFG